MPPAAPLLLLLLSIQSVARLRVKERQHRLQRDTPSPRPPQTYIHFYIQKMSLYVYTHARRAESSSSSGKKKKKKGEKTRIKGAVVVVEGRCSKIGNSLSTLLLLSASVFVDPSSSFLVSPLFVLGANRHTNEMTFFFFFLPLSALFFSLFASIDGVE